MGIWEPGKSGCRVITPNCCPYGPDIWSVLPYLCPFNAYRITEQRLLLAIVALAGRAEQAPSQWSAASNQRCDATA